MDARTTRLERHLPRKHPLSSAITACLRTSRAPIACVVGVCATLLVGGSSEAATFTVTNTNDSGPGSLRQAVLEANATPGEDQIVFSEVTGAIGLTSGQLDVTDSLRIVGPGSADLTVSGNQSSRILSLQQGSLTISGLTLTNGFAPPGEAGGAIEIQFPQLATATGALALNIQECALTNSRAVLGGGVGSYNYRGELSLSVRDSILSGNIADQGSAIGVSFFGSYSYGIPTGNIELEGVMVSSNSVSGNEGPAIAVDLRQAYAAWPYSQDPVKVTITGSEITDNRGDGILVICEPMGYAKGVSALIESTRISNNDGAGVLQSLATRCQMDIVSSIIEKNATGIRSEHGEVLIRKSSVTGNAGAGVESDYFYYRGPNYPRIGVEDSVISRNGAGIDGSDGIRLSVERSEISRNLGSGIRLGGGFPGAFARVANSTVSGNHDSGVIATESGYGTTAIIENSTITGNSSPSAGGGVVMQGTWFPPVVSLSNSIVAGNTATLGDPDISGDVEASYTLIGDLGSAMITESVPGSNLIGVDPLLGPLEDNGGPTLTHALLAGSPAIDAGDPNFIPPPEYDQRGEGFVRVYNGRIDTGAFELQPTTQPSQPLGALEADHGWTDFCRADFSDAVILLGPPTNNGGDPGVARMQPTEDAACPYQVRFAEWDYRARDFNDYWHKPEQISYLGLSPGVYTMDDGSVWEVASFENWGNGVWKTVSFQSGFSGTPTLFLTMQTANGTETTTPRARNVAPDGFDVAMFEEEYLMDGGHATETIGYVAIYHPDAGTSPSVESVATINGADVPYSLHRTWVNQNWTAVDGVELHLEEEQSLDDEVTHKDEMVDVLTIGDQVFAQQVSSYGWDTTAIRRR